MDPWISPPCPGSLMHQSCYEWVGKIVAQYDLAARPTIEVGSCNVNGTVRDHFSGAYLGVDVAEGNSVDRIEDSEHLRDADTTWANVVSTEMLEHVKRPWLAVDEMARICAPGGHVIITARGYDHRGCWEVHAYPDDMYRFSDQSMRVLAEDAGLTVCELEADPEGPGWFMHCVK
jgi:SAM-dependent methyltransferase